MTSVNDSHKHMEDYWAKISNTYGDAPDLEQQIRNFVKNFADTLPASASILELGCGNGKVLKNLGKPGRRLTGVDSSKEMIAAARTLLSPATELVCEGVAEFLQHGGAWDLVVCCNTLHNFKGTGEIAKTISGMGKITSANGFIIIDIRNIFNPFIRRGYRRSRSQGLQFYPFSYLRAQRILRQSGFDIVSTIPVFYTTPEEAGKADKPIWFRTVYSIYLALTRLTFFAPYIIIVARKEDKKTFRLM